MTFIKKTHARGLPVHVKPSASSSYPALHEQVNDPAVFVHMPLVSSQLSVFAVHSSISEDSKKLLINLIFT
jgi:hypothetical protein